MTVFNRGAARPIAPIECVPSPQAAFGMKWDCDRAEMARRLKALRLALSTASIDAWLNSIGLSAPTGGYLN